MSEGPNPITPASRPGAPEPSLSRELTEKHRQLQQTLAEFESFAQTLAHDLRAPLRAVNTFTTIVLEDYGATLDDEAKDLLQKVLAAAVRMDALVQNVLAFSRVSRAPTELMPVDLEKLARELSAGPTFRSEAAELQIRRPLLPMRGHEPFVRLCLAQLLDNAVKFVAPGVRPRICLSSQPNGNQVRLWVQDNGIGIAGKEQGRVFEPFQRLSSEYDGNGLGLAVVRRAAERMGGSVGVESEPGKGSRFWLELPKA
jgi:signal transduction histidine kinase